MKKSATILLCLLCSAGCARFSTNQTDYRYDAEGKVATKVQTKAAATTFFAGKAALSNWKATQSESNQGAEVGSVDQSVEDAGAELALIIESVAKGVVAGLAK